MKKLKKLATLLLSFSLIASVGFSIVACEKEPAPSSSSEVSESTSEPETSEDDSSGDDETPDGGDDDTPDEIVQPTLNTTVDEINDPEHVWTTWEAVQQPTCLINGIKQRVCQNNPDHIHQDYIAARGHDYTKGNGFCSCGDGPIFPKDAPNKTFINPADPECGIKGNGTDYNRYELTEGYVKVECTGNPIWLSFATQEHGQYALYSTNGARGTQLKRYDASAHYIPTMKDGVFGETGNDFDYYIGFEANLLEDGNHYSTINCPANIWSTEWRATWSVVGEEGTILYLRFVKIAEAAWTPGYVKDKVIAQQINGRAPEGEAGTEAALVPYDTDYFYDDTTGYYRMGTKENPGATIFAAITAPAPRMLLDKAFTMIQYEGDNLSLPFGTTADGDYLLKDYCPFIMNDESYGGTYNSYQTFVNSDGMYPVNQELFTFLNLYVDKNKPMDIPEEIWKEKRENAWLAPCYYYANLTPGSAEFPIEVGADGTITGTTLAWDSIYYTVKHTPQDGQMAAYCTLTWNDSDLTIQDVSTRVAYKGPNMIVFETNGMKGFTFAIGDAQGDARDFEIQIVDGYKGSQTDPIIWTELGDKTLETVEILAPTGSTYVCMYTWEATADGTVLVTTDDDFYLTLGDNTVLKDGKASLDVTAGEIVTFFIMAQEDITVNANVSFTPAV